MVQVYAFWNKSVIRTLEALQASYAARPMTGQYGAQYRAYMLLEEWISLEGWI